MTDVLSTPSGTVPPGRATRWNPSPEELRELTSRMPNAKHTDFDNYNVQTRVVSRSKGSTYIVTDRPDEHSDQTVDRAEGERIAQRQDEYIRGQEMLVVDGYIGNDPDHRVPARLYIESANANIAGMQRWLYFDAESPGPGFEPTLTIIYTPNLVAPGYPNDRVIAVDLEAGITRVLNSDYFGESKKGGLRMWNKLTYDKGGLSLHAGCKVVPTAGGEQAMLIIGLSGTGKTTTTFTRQNDSKPVQDDFVALYPGGRVVATENGCFAKTFALDPKFEPTIHGAVCKPEAYLENVSQHNGTVDFFDTSYTQNGRAVFRMDALGWHKDAREVSAVDHLLILNRNENIIPAVARLSREQAALYFMLGETQGTSAGGKDEEGKFLRVPGTNPFFPLRHEQQGNRFLELLDSCNFQVYLLNTGRVGGPDGDERSKKVTIPYSSAVVKAIAEGTIQWEIDPDFGYEVAAALPDVDDAEILQPRRLYERQGRGDEYAATVQRLKQERRDYVEKFPGLRPEIVRAIA
ncbi:MAG: phosphoenolpyruvate carboxykinase [Candidatus Dormibacteraeota bacterium]|nr:phosphoenolpyruvate carboxykinase [Candidatus Dormibacteraeota bacterium]MBV9526174.1 phosphoenolpyruvate carboxykinase [Candidatus Dormibacteraeota bacterium]